MTEEETRFPFVTGRAMSMVATLGTVGVLTAVAGGEVVVVEWALKVEVRGGEAEGTA